MFSHVYFIHEKENYNLFKIGKANNVLKRKKSLQTAHGESLTVFKHMTFGSEAEALHKESILKSRFQSKRANGEWFRITPDDIEQVMDEYWMEMDFKCKQEKSNATSQKSKDEVNRSDSKDAAFETTPFATNANNFETDKAQIANPKLQWKEYLESGLLDGDVSDEEKNKIKKRSLPETKEKSKKKYKIPGGMMLADIIEQMISEGSIKIVPGFMVGTRGLANFVKSYSLDRNIPPEDALSLKPRKYEEYLKQVLVDAFGIKSEVYNNQWMTVGISYAKE